ncbi:gamma-glutamylcyclotransferase-like [Ornithodoros turicata]|uniref:gamma-glutamylcyclotransferase-like n=1 Tax=Ornithodoros turicata TaxID=34597 RepID=UPI00313883A9
MSSTRILYFAYGSNMWSHRMHIRNSRAGFVGVGKLNGYRLTFVGDSEAWRGATATIAPADTACCVQGVVWSLPHEDVPILDEQESGYNGMDVKVELPSGEKKSCRTYIHKEPKVDESKPSAVYKRIIIAGALEHKLPGDYVQNLLKLQDNGCCNGIAIPVDISKLHKELGGKISV